MIDYSKYESAIGLNWYEIDPDLQLLMRQSIPPEDFAWSEGWLKKWGAVCGGPIAQRAEITDKNPPKLVKYDRNGMEINEVVHHPTAIETKRDLWNNGFNGLPWSDEAKRRGRPVPASMMTAFSYFLAEAETGMLCSIGMTAGAAELIERYGDDRVKAEFLPRMRSMNYDEAWDGAMFLTERTGGSDLGVLTTTARKSGDTWLLNGLKWFCSNVDAKVIMTVARPVGAPEGIKGIGLFAVPKTKRDGTRNGIHIRRIKDKLGTRAVPTAEVDFVDAEAYILQGNAQDPWEHGINRMMEMVNLSRVGVGIMGAGIARRSFFEASIYASRRDAFGRRLTDWPLMREDLLKIQMESESASAMVFECARVADQARNKGDENAASYLRILAPLTKMRATRQGIECASKSLEVVGGNGYIEDWPMARQFRDAQCHTIWEGADNIMVLDSLRAMAKHQSHEPLLQRVASIAGQAKHSSLQGPRKAIEAGLGVARDALTRMASADGEEALAMSKHLADLFCDLVQGALLVEEASEEISKAGSGRKALIARMYCENRLAPPARSAPRAIEQAALKHFDAMFRYGKVSPSEI
ncbi:MAG: acyl-CoA dehydrogenase family protein [Nitrospirae bacterium]|nr:acyl-CoA dehydrogenase family protein [Nitrospirota bacterium]